VDEIRPLFARRLSPRQLLALDALGAGVFAAVFLPVSDGGSSSPMGVAVVLGLSLPVAVRRIWPGPVFLLLAVLAVVASVDGIMAFASLPAACALYVVASHGRVGRGVPTTSVAVAALLAVLVLMCVGPGQPWVSDLIFAVGALGGAWTVGRAVAERRVAAARDAELLAERVIAEERLRIARDLHDVVAHSMGLIAVTAGVANHVLPTRPDEAHAALRMIEAESRNAMTEMRQLLGVLRTGPPDRAPAQGLAALPDLVERTRLAGVTVQLDVAGTGGVPDGVGMSAYRIVQEALANVVKHAAPTHCVVRVEADGRVVWVEAVDDGSLRRTSPARAAGHGLLGMRERVLAYGGSFEAGPRPDASGFRVAATLPYAEAT
jgi:signal transduction histidine kinase